MFLWRCRGLRWRTLAVASVASALLGAPEHVLRAQPRIQMQVPAHGASGPRLAAYRRIGTANGQDDAFARISFVTLRADGGVLVLDDKDQKLKWFGRPSAPPRTVGKRGAGPGEFETPWLVVTDDTDSVFVWDMALSRVTVWTPDLRFARSFPSPAGWQVNGMLPMTGGVMLMSAFDRSTSNVLHVVNKKGERIRSALPLEWQAGTAPFENSLLGGFLARSGDKIIFSQKSPYRIVVLDSSLRVQRVCEGPSSATTTPGAVVSRSARGDQLRWREYVRSAAVLPTPVKGIVLNVIVDDVKAAGRGEC